MGSWVDGFMYFTSEAEAPDSYLKLAALHTLSAALQRHVYTMWGYYRFYPNFYGMLVGPPGITHKSATIAFSRDFLKAIGVPTASEGISREALITQMKTRGGKDVQNIAITASEFATFMRTSGGAMVEFLNDIYDSPADWEYTTKIGGTVTITAPYVTLLGGVVPEWMAREFNQSFVEGGFASRTLFVRERVPRFLKARPVVTEHMLTVKLALVEDLAEITKLDGEYHWTTDAHAWFDHWYENLWFVRESGKELRGYESRTPSHLIRIAMLMKASHSCELVLDAEDFKDALELISFLAPRMADAFSVVGRNPYTNDYERIVAEVETAGRITYTTLLRSNSDNLTKMQLDEILENLRSMGKLKITTYQGTLWYEIVG